MRTPDAGIEPGRRAYAERAGHTDHLGVQPQKQGAPLATDLTKAVVVAAVACDSENMDGSAVAIRLAVRFP
jgi:hypothetical protein